jgi:hypothetical protein
MNVFELGFAILVIVIALFLSKFFGSLLGVSWYFFVLPLLVIAFLILRWIGRCLSRRN